jgi:hypothetical protein
MYLSNLYTCVPCTDNAIVGVSGLKAVQSVSMFVKLWQAEIRIVFHNQKCGNQEMRLGLAYPWCVL